MDGQQKSQDLTTSTPTVVKLKLPTNQYKITSGYRDKSRVWNWHYDESKNLWINTKNKDGYGEHKGYDFLCPSGSPIRACVTGRILQVGWENPKNEKQGFGYRIIQEFKRDGEKWLLYYGHLSLSYMATSGDEAETGQIIANSGNTGHSTGAHLHVELRNYSNQQPHEIRWL